MSKVSQTQTPRTRRRSEPLAGIFDEEVVPLLAESLSLRAVTIFDELCRRHPRLPAGAATAASHRKTAASTAPAATSSSAIEQALLLRGSRDFDDLAAYRAFIAAIVGRHNARHRARIDAERAVGMLPRRLPHSARINLRPDKYEAAAFGEAAADTVVLEDFDPRRTLPGNGVADHVAAAMRFPVKICAPSLPCSHVLKAPAKSARL